MKNNKKLKILFGIVICVVTLLTAMVPIYAASYSTYTYSIDGTQLSSPDAYTPAGRYDSVNTGVYEATGFNISEPRDMVVDVDGNIYIVDIAQRDVVDSNGKPITQKSNRIIVLDRYYKFRYEITSFVNDMGVQDTFNNPGGMCVTADKIYVADTNNSRIVVLNRVYGGRSAPTFNTIIPAPKADILADNSIYRPVAVASNGTHVYVVSSTTYMGIISLDENGVFQGFVGAQKVNVNALAALWRIWQTEEQRANMFKNVPTEYNNIVIDKEGFIYVTTSTISQTNQQNAINNRSAGSDYAPVKKINMNGDDVLTRTGFYPPSGEVRVSNRSLNGEPTGASRIIDVAVGPEGTWSIIDEKRQRVFTYDSSGNLLFAFGDSGKQLGNLQSIEALAYQDSNMLLLDKDSGSFTVYTRTEYGDLLLSAIEHENRYLYDLAVEDYRSILQRNINFDMAYIGIAKALYRSGDYEGAMEQYAFAYNTRDYSSAFKMYRKNMISKYIIIVPIVVVALFAGVYYFFKYASKVNAKTAITTGKRTFKQEILFAFHLIFHPMDGYWDLKHEKRGSVRGAAFYIMIAVLSFTFQSMWRSYMYNPRGTYSSFGTQFFSIVVPLALWVVANWCLTTLFDGEGSLKDILVATGYSLAPVPMFIIPATLLTHILASTESQIITFLISANWVWVGLLLFFGVMVTHDYSIVKNMLTCVGTIVGMAFIMFICILFSTLVSDMIGLVNSIITEVAYRLQ